MKSRISATEAVCTFFRVDEPCALSRESFVVERGGKPICEIQPAAPVEFRGGDLLDLLRSLPKPDEGYFAAVEEAIRKPFKTGESGWPR
jgi:hypothetical protein